MMAISADEVDRMLFKNGLASPTLIQHEKNEMMRRAWANRRVTEKATTLTDINSFVKQEPPVSALIKQWPKTQRAEPNEGLSTPRAVSRPAERPAMIIE